jgi:DNA-binding LytR/AlgR family response regulator
MRIAICDDDIMELDKLSGLLKDYRKKNKAYFTFKTYSDSVEFLEDVRKGGFDFLLLDVMMPLANGMEIAREIREFEKDVKIAFITSTPDFAVESYAVEAFTYLLKPVTEEKLFPVQDKLFRFSHKPEDCLSVRFQNGVAKIPFHKIAYVEVANRMLFIHLTDGSLRKLSASLSDYESLFLQRPEFIRVHRAFLVNLCQIQELRSKEILTYTGRVVPVSRRLYAQVRKAYMDQLFAGQGVE